MPKQQPGTEPQPPPARPALAEDLPRFLVLEREVEMEYRSQMLAALQAKVDAVADAARHCACVSALPAADALPGYAGGLLAGSLRMFACFRIALSLPAVPL